MRVGVVVNPRSGPRAGGRAGPSRVETARLVLARLGMTADVVETARAGHAADLAQAFVARQCDRVVVWGGDGTINDAAGPLIGATVILGIVPGGSGDGLARSLGLSAPADHALEVALTAPARGVDVGYLGGRHFLNIGGVGFDAAVAKRFNETGTRGLRTYIRLLLRMIWTYEPESYRLVVDGAASTGPRFLVAFANGREYGNRMTLVPLADARDGWLDVVTVAGGSPVCQLWRARRLAWRPGRPARGIAWGRCRAATVTGDRLVCHVDGEPFETSGTIEVGIRPGAILVAGAGGDSA